MEIMDWLEPSISKSIEEVIEESEVYMRPIDDEFKSAFNILVERHPESKKKLIKLENLFLRRYELIEIGYRKGFEDGFKL